MSEKDLKYELDQMQTHVAETRLQRNWFRIFSLVFPIVAPNSSQSIDPWKWNEVDFSLHLSWSVFCSSSIQAPFVSRFIDSCWRCERHCCRWKCRRRQNHRRHQRHLRSQSSQRHRRDLWGREDREGVGPLWLWHAWYLLQEHVLRSGGFQMTGGRLHRLVFVVSCAVLWVQKCQKRMLEIYCKLDQMQTHVAETRLQRNWFRIVSFVFPMALTFPQIHPNPKIHVGMKWISPSIFHGLSFALHQFRHPSFPVSLTAGVVSATAAGTKGTWGPWGPRAPKGTAGTYGAGKIGKGWDLCGFDMLDIFCRNMFWGLADFRWLWVDSIFWYLLFLVQSFGCPNVRKGPEI